MSAAVTVDVGVDSSRFKRGLDSMRKRASAWKKSIGVQVAGALAAAGVVRSMRQVADEMDRIQKLGKRFDLGVEFLQKLGFAAEQSGSNLEDAAKFMQKLMANVAEAEDSTSLADAFEDLNLEVDKLRVMGPQDLLEAVADASRDAAGNQKKMNALLAVGGKSAGELLPLLREGAEGIRELGEGINVVDQGDVDALARYNDELNRLSTNLKVKLAQATVIGGQAIEDFGNRLGTGTAAIIGWITGNDDLIHAAIDQREEFEAEAWERQNPTGPNGEKNGFVLDIHGNKVSTHNRPAPFLDNNGEALDTFEQMEEFSRLGKERAARMREAAEGLPPTATEPLKDRSIVLDQFRRIGGNLGNSLTIETDKEILKVNEEIKELVEDFKAVVEQKDDGNVDATFSGFPSEF